MKPGYKIVTVNRSNLDQLGFFCVSNKKHPGYLTKINWLKIRFSEGLKIDLIQTNDGKTAGFLEYVPGEFTWWIINAPNYLVIHCLWVNSKKIPQSGMSSALLKNCVRVAESSGKTGVVVVTSDGSWMAGKEIFLKNGFVQVDFAEPHFQLLTKNIKDGPEAKFPTDWQERLKRFEGLNLIYTHQCPYIGKAVNEMPQVADKHDIQLKMIELMNSSEARKIMPSPYGMFNLVHDGKLLADHPISATRFKNILQKDLKLEPLN